MSWRAVMVYWVLALVVTGQLAWTLKSRAHPTDAQPATAAPPVVETPGSAIDDVLVQRDELRLEFRKDSGRWESEEAPKVSSDLVAAFIDTLTTIPPIEAIPEGSGALSTYGLDPPQGVVRMAASGRPVAVLELGTRNPTRTAVYARRPDRKQVYLLGLNAQYYLDLIFEQAGAPRSPAGAS